MKVWKYEIGESDCEIEMPDGAQILTVQVQDGKPYIWALVNPENYFTIRRFITYVTGSFADIHEYNKYIGTYQIDWFVGHVFERLKK